MKTLRRIIALLLLVTGCAFSQTPTFGNVGVLLDQNFTVGSSLLSPIPVSGGQFSGMNFYKLEFNPLSATITSCSVIVNSDLTGIVISSQNCTTQGNANSGTIAVSANNLNVQVVIAGTGYVRMRLLGAMSTFAASGSGTVTNITTGTGLQGGPCTGTCTVSLANTGVAA